VHISFLNAFIVPDMVSFLLSSTLIANWYKKFQEGMQEYVDERVELQELVRKLSNQQEVFGSQMVQGSVPDSKMENLRRLLVTKDDEHFKNQQRQAKLRLANA
jgi:hypothetical protein